VLTSILAGSHRAMWPGWCNPAGMGFHPARRAGISRWPRGDGGCQSSGLHRLRPRRRGGAGFAALFRSADFRNRLWNRNAMAAWIDLSSDNGDR